MTIKETMEKYEGQYADVEVYRNFNSNRMGFHTDRIRSVEDYSSDDEAIECELMDESDYNNSILANTSLSANFAEWYDDANAKILVLKIN